MSGKKEVEESVSVDDAKDAPNMNVPAAEGLGIHTGDGSPDRDKRSRAMDDPAGRDADEDAKAAPLTVRPGKHGGAIADGEGWGQNMVRNAPRVWHGTRDGRGCEGAPLEEADPENGFVKGQCPKCGARFEQPEMRIDMVELDENQKRALSREDQRRTISRETLARFLAKHKVSVLPPDLVPEYDAAVRKAYKHNGL